MEAVTYQLTPSCAKAATNDYHLANSKLVKIPKELIHDRLAEVVSVSNVASVFRQIRVAIFSKPFSIQKVPIRKTTKTFQIYLRMYLQLKTVCSYGISKMVSVLYPVCR